ncbi:MAG TPA: outer membrane beta-barrel protein [Balneolales bacterium]|nr:outer membrane beta-barrel protein [Balneolales bacterium]
MKKLFSKLRMLPLLILLILITTSTAWAQWSIGGSYEIRSKTPKNGFGVRIERSIPLPLPLVSIVGRAHFSYFSENNKITKSGTYKYSTDFKDYDFGLTALAKVKLGIIDPYAGIGIGSTNYKVDIKDLGNPQSQNSVIYNVTFGSDVALIPHLHPFVEYRITKNNFKDFNFTANTGAIKQQVDTSPGRVIFGLLLQF